jgi:hypothetical protein
LKLVSYSTGGGALKVDSVENGRIVSLGDASVLEYIEHGRGAERRPGGEEVALSEATLHAPIARAERQ